MICTLSKTCFFLLFSITLFSQSAVYSIKVAGVEVGQQKVIENKTGNRVDVHVITKVEISMGIKYQLIYDQSAIFEDGILLSSKVIVTKNGSIHSKTITTKKGNTYTVEKDGKKHVITREVPYSSSLSYFHEPINKSFRYSEANGVLETLTYINKGVYAAAKTKRNEGNLYYYKNGVLQKSVVNSSTIKFTVELVEYQN